MVAFLAFGADILVTLLAELHARPVGNVDALAASVARSTTVAVPPVFIALITGKGLCDAQFGTGDTPLEDIIALFEDVRALIVFEHDEAGAWRRANDVLSVLWVDFAV